MSLLDKLFVVLLSSAILLSLFGIAMLFLSYSKANEIKQLKKRKFKNKKKQKQLQKIRKKAEAKKNRQRRLAFFCLLLFLATAGSAIYTRYYQLTNLNAEDADAVAKSYYLTGEIEKQIKAVENGASPEKTIKNLRNLSAQLASASVKTASQEMSVEGQKLLNRHLALTRNLAVNISNQTQDTIADANTRETYLNDINKVVESEQTVFNYFKVNKSALEQKK